MKIFQLKYKALSFLLFLSVSYQCHAYPKDATCLQEVIFSNKKINNVFVNEADFEKQESALVMTVHNVQSEKGHVCLVLWDKAFDFLKMDQKPFRYMRAKSKQGSMKFLITGLEKGKAYSLFVHHDREDKNKFEVGIFGPSDPYAFGNNASSSFSAPKYEETLITIEKNLNEHEVTL